jgi:mevalonate kinase
MQLKASAPGSLMMLGEYGVLHGKHAMVCAVNKRITVVVTPRTDTCIDIQSSIHGHYTTELAQIQIEKPFQFVLGVLQHFQLKMKTGCDINIVSDFSDKVGLGSSAAVTVATFAAISNWLNVKMSPSEMVRQARTIVRTIQGGVGSGADVAASVLGGIVGYQSQPFYAEKIPFTHPITVLYSGFKTPTVDAIKRVTDHFADHPGMFRQITNSIGQCAVEGMQFARSQDWVKFGKVMNMQQGMMEALGVSTKLLHDMVEDLRKQTGILGAKISGSGLGDCVIGLGKLPVQYTYICTGLITRGIQCIPVEMTLQGVHCEKI